MTAIIIGGSSSRCQECFDNGKPSSAYLNESGHFTVAGFNFSIRDTGGCQTRWDSVVSVYTVNNRATFIERMKYLWPSLRNIPDDKWSVTEHGETNTKEPEAATEEVS